MELLTKPSWRSLTGEFDALNGSAHRCASCGGTGHEVEPVHHAALSLPHSCVFVDSSRVPFGSKPSLKSSLFDERFNDLLTKTGKPCGRCSALCSRRELEIEYR
jgi:hypothetical protein